MSTREREAPAGGPWRRRPASRLRSWRSESSASVAVAACWLWAVNAAATLVAILLRRGVDASRAGPGRGAGAAVCRRDLREPWRPSTSCTPWTRRASWLHWRKSSASRRDTPSSLFRPPRRRTVPCANGPGGAVRLGHRVPTPPAHADAFAVRVARGRGAADHDRPRETLPWCRRAYAGAPPGRPRPAHGHAAGVGPPGRRAHRPLPPRVPVRAPRRRRPRCGVRARVWRRDAGGGAHRPPGSSASTPRRPR